MKKRTPSARDGKGQRSIQEAFDALEAGIIRLREERDELRKRLEGKAEKPKATVKPVVRSRAALGRTLGQLRKPVP